MLHRVYSSVASEARVLPCDVIAAARRRHIPMLLHDVIAAARRRPRLPAPPRSVFGRELFSGRLPSNAPLRTPAAQPNSWLTCHNIYIVTCYATENTLRIINSFIYKLTLQSVIPLCHIRTVHNVIRRYSTEHYPCWPTTAKTLLQDSHYKLTAVIKSKSKSNCDWRSVSQ
jgi:hypothetical protein